MSPLKAVGPNKGQIQEICNKFVLSTEDVGQIMSRLLVELKRGLGKDTNAEATVKCFSTYVKELPNGHEVGKFLALDLGGTNFRVLLIKLGEGQFTMESKIFAVPQKIMLGPGSGLFDHIADCLANFMDEQNVRNETLPLGFTFSFPCRQEGLTKARLVTWTKGFNCSGVEGENVVALLEQAIARRGDIGIEVCAALNDTTGCLMSCAWYNRNCLIGVIIGTGCNACYMEKLENVELYDGTMEGPNQVVVNTEWGAFGDNGVLDFIRTEYDLTVDRCSLNPGKQLYEKMISGMYMGEIVRQVLVDLVQKKLIFNGLDYDLIMEKGQFFTKYVSEIESDPLGEYDNARNVLEDELNIVGVTDEDCENVRFVCESVSSRAAYLSAAAIGTLLNKINQPKVTVAVDGSVYRFHPFFHDRMVAKITEVLAPGLKFDLMLSEDGSGRGAALVAAVACRIERERKSS